MRHSTSHFLLTLLLLSSFLIGCQPTSPQTGPEPATVTHTYIATDAIILNPERGFFTPYELPGSAGFSPVRATGNTLVHLNIRLDDWRETDIPQDVLNGLDSNFADIRDAGVKAIIRFAYNQGPYPDSEPDASKAQILRHIEQLTPLLQSNADVIAWLEAGFIGAWGEWHTSTNGLDNLPDKQEILFALLKALPETRMVQVRYPANIIEMFPTVLIEDQAFVGSNQSRVAHHNDCFLSSETDVGTYERDGEITIERDQAYLAELTRFTPMSGETCAPNPPRSECRSALQEMALLHFSAINEAYHKGILRSWEEGSCLEEISNRLGYRLTLMSADFNEQVRPGGLLNLTVNLQNTGFASIINEHPLYIVLVGQDGILSHEVILDIDSRSWEPGTATFTTKLHIPSNIPEGEYSLGLWLPDAYESLRANPFYAIQFANENVWDESTGYNLLGTINVDKGASGSYQRGEKFEVIESTSSVERSVTSLLVATPSIDELLSHLRLLTDNKNITVEFRYSGVYKDFQVFLDTDQNIQTGMKIEEYGGIDFLLENNVLYSYNGSGLDWSWIPVDTEVVVNDDGQTIKWIIARSALENTDILNMRLKFVDANSNDAFALPKITYTLR